MCFLTDCETKFCAKTADVSKFGQTFQIFQYRSRVLIEVKNLHFRSICRLEFGRRGGGSLKRPVLIRLNCFGVTCLQQSLACSLPCLLSILISADKSEILFCKFLPFYFIMYCVTSKLSLKP